MSETPAVVINEDPDTPPADALEALAGSALLAAGVAGTRAETAEAKLAAIEAHCRKAVDTASRTAYMPVDPWDVRVSAGAVLAIIGDDPDKTSSEEGTAT